MGRKDWLIDLGSGCGWKRKKGEGIVVVERFGSIDVWKVEG